eukprot:1708819-Ditylum_brightwellii.AAC.1
MNVAEKGNKAFSKTGSITYHRCTKTMLPYLSDECNYAMWRGYISIHVWVSSGINNDQKNHTKTAAMMCGIKDPKETNTTRQFIYTQCIPLPKKVWHML